MALSLGVGMASPPGTASDSAALAILSTSKQASGGAAWDRIAGWHERGVHGDVSYETELDFQRYGTVFKNTRQGETKIRGYNGRVAWDEDANGHVSISTDPARLAEARQSAYGSTYAWFLADRFPARFEYLGVAADKSATYDAIRISPVGATPMDIWIDRASHLVTKLIDRSGSTSVTVTLSDFRDVGGVKINFGLLVSDGDPSHTEVGRVEDVSFTPPTVSADFDPPGQR